ncbi:MAG: ComF family protein [Geobacteraceae bacterium]|jgi:predicted amidophosphoribosyltransferase|nr:MAG: ComF family protein [Geobacteraceae bacterium]RPJ05256.1 MAG: ComF family protein [Deltaproteobacteria bacterium]
MSIEIRGRWKKGFAHDVHTLGSVYMGVDEYGHVRWDTTRSEMGELVYQLKYNGDTSAISKIVDLLGKYKGLETMDAIIPIPSTNKSRVTQPVYAIARELGKRLGVPVIEDALEKRGGGQQLKNVEDQDERAALLREHMVLAGNHDLSGKNVLLLDDLYRSGATLQVAADMLYDQASCKDVFVLTMTKTRSRR